MKHLKLYENKNTNYYYVLRTVNGNLYTHSRCTLHKNSDGNYALYEYGEFPEHKEWSGVNMKEDKYNQLIKYGNLIYNDIGAHYYVFKYNPTNDD